LCGRDGRTTTHSLVDRNPLALAPLEERFLGTLVLEAVPRVEQLEIGQERLFSIFVVLFHEIPSCIDGFSW